MNSRNPYHQVAYPTVPQRATHPDRLAAIGTLFGMHPAPVTRCRTLEIGCGDAANLIPLAYHFPGSSFVGLDLAPRPIARARKQAARLGLGSLALQVLDLTAIGPELGEFDYILAHGLYSWISAASRDALLALIRARLAPSGVAFVSYNTLPGRYPRQMLREMMLHHTQGAPNIQKAREFLRWLGEKNTAGDVWNPLLTREINRLLEAGEGGFFHDDLAPVNDPLYFSDFAENGARHGLQYLGDAELHQMFDHAGNLAGRRLTIIEREQHLDFLKLRAFRQTLLCHTGVRLRRRPSPKQMDRFLFSSAARLDAPVSQALADAYPLPLPFEELLPYAASPGILRQFLFDMATHGALALHTHDYPCEESVTARPRASRLARLQAATSLRVVNACHDLIELDEIGRRLILLLDGNRDHQAIARDLAATPHAPRKSEIARTLPASLKWMAHMALLEG